MLEEITAMTDEEFQAIFQAVAAEKEKRERRITARSKLTNAVVAILPAINEYREATSAKKIGSIIDAILKELDAAPEEPEETEEETPTENGKTPQEWVQPTGAHDAYKAGDVVTYQNETWRSTQDGNVWSPTAYPQGWEKI